MNDKKGNVLGMAVLLDHSQLLVHAIAVGNLLKFSEVLLQKHVLLLATCHK